MEKKWGNMSFLKSEAAQYVTDAFMGIKDMKPSDIL